MKPEIYVPNLLFGVYIVIYNVIYLSGKFRSNYSLNLPPPFGMTSAEGVYLYQLHILNKIKLPNQLSRQGQGRDESWQRQGLSTPWALQRHRNDDDDTNPKKAVFRGKSLKTTS